MEGEGRLWSKPSLVISSDTGRLEQEDASGRFHGQTFMQGPEDEEWYDRVNA